MRVKTSITLDESVLRAVDKVAGKSSRSRVIEEALLRFLKERARAARDARDRDLLDRHAKRLNAEMSDILQFQVEPD
jgi:metal-responsive CopG/Arc/MetJ family transcriptional regulator